MIHEITCQVEKYKTRKRIGRGQGSGHGKTSGRGHKGARSRSGWSSKPAREGGQLAYFRRLPKVGFSNSVFANNFHIINVRDLENHFDSGSNVDAKALVAKGLIRDTTLPVKVLGVGDLTKKITITAGRASKTAQEKIEKAGGSISIVTKVKWTRATHGSDKSKNSSKAK
jgi:large subunit ribosomal protein L15